MDNLQKSVVASLDGRDLELYPFLAYLLQDLWEIGASPHVMGELIRKHRLNTRNVRKVLDLGCGKGAISIHLAKTFGFFVHGIDAFPAFVEEARQRTQAHHVERSCTFEVGDIRSLVAHLHDYDLVILGSIGPVLGTVAETLEQVKGCVCPGKYIIFDDGYLPDESLIRHPGYFRRTEVLEQIRKSQVKILDEYIFDQALVVESDQEIFSCIQQRAFELMEQYPDKKALFEGYLQAQEEENEILEDHATCVTWLLQRVD